MPCDWSGLQIWSPTASNPVLKKGKKQDQQSAFDILQVTCSFTDQGEEQRPNAAKKHAIPVVGCLLRDRTWQLQLLWNTPCSQKFEAENHWSTEMFSNQSNQKNHNNLQNRAVATADLYDSPFWLIGYSTIPYINHSCRRSPFSDSVFSAVTVFTFSLSYTSASLANDTVYQLISNTNLQQQFKFRPYCMEYSSLPFVIFDEIFWYIGECARLSPY